MESMAQLAILTGAAFGAWIITELRGRAQSQKPSVFGPTAATLLVLLGLIAGWVVRLSTGSDGVLVTVALAVAIAALAELVQMF